MSEVLTSRCAVVNVAYVYCCESILFNTIVLPLGQTLCFSLMSLILGLITSLVLK
jgi:hypothetical protein